MSQRRTKSDSPVAAREALDEANATPATPSEEEAKEQERQQAQELRDGSKVTGLERKASKVHQDLSDKAPAGARAGVPGNAHTQGGFMDQLSKRSGSDALEGHFVRIDLNDKDVKKAYEQMFPDGHDGDYGVYIEPVLRDPETGIPVTALVRLRDDTNARLELPYEALRPAGAGGR